MNIKHSSPMKLNLNEFRIPAMLGAILPLSLLIFLILANRSSYALWMLFPLLIIPSGGAVGGIFFYLMGFHWFPKGNQKLLAILFSTVIYFVIVWLSSVFAFSLTGHWN